eukprot:m.308616 g.308616  ORF g.308616 m.308616 type:complete len:233 (+) comp44379_c0_seq1:98-796(+)
MGGCLGSPPDEASGERDATGSVAIGRNKPLKRTKIIWNANGPMTDGQLRSKRDEFWETQPAFGGRREIWDALKAAAEAAEDVDYDLAQAIIEGANVTLPKGDLTECYDELGDRYVIPNYCLSTPKNMVSEGDEQASSKAFHLQPAGHAVEEETEKDDAKFPLKLRLSTGSELRLRFKETATIGQVKQEIAEKEGLDTSALRLFYSGQLLVDKATVQSCKIAKGYIVQVIVSQ